MLSSEMERGLTMKRIKVSLDEVKKSKGNIEILNVEFTRVKRSVVERSSELISKLLETRIIKNCSADSDSCYPSHNNQNGEADYD